MFEYPMSSNRSLVEAGPSTRSPQPTGQGSLAPVRRPRIIGELLVVLLLLRAYDLVRGHAEVRELAALHHGQQLLDVERWLHIDIELSANLWTTQQTALSLVASYWYQFAHLTVTLGVLVWCWWRRARSYRRARNALVLTNVFGLIIFLVYPAAPPRFLPGFGFVDAVANAGFGATHGGPVTADQFGAFPSLHLAWAVWTAVVAHRLVRSKTLRRLWLCYPLITALVVVVTGNHYLLDIVAGSLIALVTLAIAHRIPGRRGDDGQQPGGDSAAKPDPANRTRLKSFLSSSDAELVPSRRDP
jgi:membrane-associated phospholipid phosphatase